MSDRPATSRVLRWTVPVDDQPHEIGGGQVLHTETREIGRVEVWTLESLETAGSRRTVQVFGTGQPLPANHRGHIGSTLDGPLVWHVFLLDTTSENA